MLVLVFSPHICGKYTKRLEGSSVLAHKPDLGSAESTEMLGRLSNLPVIQP